MIEFSWDFSYLCNYKCSYCFYSAAGGEPLARFSAPAHALDSLENNWKAIYDSCGSCRIFLTGGEPFMHPHFMEIVKRLSQYHSLHITTNLSLPVDAFMRAASPKTVQLNATYHPLHADIGPFCEKVLDLRKHGFRCGVCFLAHPLHFREMLNYRKFFKHRGIDMSLTLFHGRYNGKTYPAAYTREEKRFMAWVEHWEPGKPYSDLAYAAVTPASVHDTLASWCAAGTTSAVIRFNGDIVPCGRLGKPVMGNIYDGSFFPEKEPRACAVHDCPERKNARVTSAIF